MKIPSSILKKIQERHTNHSFRQVQPEVQGVDFTSNDYLGFATSKDLRQKIETRLQIQALNGAKASRLLGGNHDLYPSTEEQLANFHKAETALIFNSGYLANLSLLSCLPQKGDTILYDRNVHASIRDGIRLSHAHSYSFSHNNPASLQSKLNRVDKGNCYVVVESVYSMDGNMAPLAEIAQLCKSYNAYLIVDEAHATGVIGEKGEGLVQELGLEKEVFARMHTMGKAIGGHGAVVLGPRELREYLVNFARPFMYTTALGPQPLIHISEGYRKMESGNEVNQLQRKINYFIEQLKLQGMEEVFMKSETAIQGVLVPGNTAAKKVAKRLNELGYGVLPVMHPTVAEGEERIRICLHANHKEKEIKELIEAVKILLEK